MHKRGFPAAASNISLVSGVLGIAKIDNEQAIMSDLRTFFTSGSQAILVFPFQTGWRKVDEEVNRDKNGEADGMNLEVDSKDEVMHI